ncbi:MAG TPA: hypothetical protein VGO47_14515 [Chlamydiales bacterium]|nr:hypothetical protein [Chlamydiales bacterium]
MQETTREIVKEVLGLDNDEDITSHDPPPPPVICLFETNYESGPELDDLRLDMKGKLLSEWNQAVARLLTDEFKNQQKCHGLPERSDAYMKDIFLEKIKRLRTIWRDAQPHTNLDGSVETVEDLETRLFRKKVTVTTSARRNTRRENVSLSFNKLFLSHKAQKYNWRIRTVTTTLQLKEAENASDIKIWAWLRVMLQHLGPEGMSSEDTCTEGLETVYRVKILNWRHNIENELSIIDRQRILDADIFSPRGSKPAKRLRSDGNPVSTRKPVKKLPRALYDDAWYQLKPKEYRELTLCVSKEQFERIGNITALVQS